MRLDRFLIAPYKSGLVNNVEPWLIPDDSFESLRNAYVFRGRVIKRFGARLMDTSVDAEEQPLRSRLRIALAGGAGVGTTDGAGAAAGIVPGAAGAQGQMFSIGTTIYTVQTTGAAVAMLRTDGTTTATFNTVTGAYTFAGAPAGTQIFFYPNLPVMGLISRETTSINFEPLIGFDTQFSYTYTGNGWTRFDAATAFTGTDADFFWGANWRGLNADDNLLFVTNFVQADGIKYTQGTNWTTITPIVNGAGDQIFTARIIFPFKDRLVLLNTIETQGSFQNRCRFSQNGSPISADAFHEPSLTPGKGGFIDAPTKEAIITARILKDRLIVYFERSTWELVYVGNRSLPFVWQQIDSELGAESTFSAIFFDKVILGIGNVGIHACNGANVERIDNNIPNEVFDINSTDEGLDRVYGVRDYWAEVVYWALPEDNANLKYPSQILVYNYKNGSWAFNDDTITCFGYYQPSNARTWAGMTSQWYQETSLWVEPSNNARFRNVVAGNQEGFVFIIESREESRNAPALQITDMATVGSATQLTVINHNLDTGDTILIEFAQGVTNLNDLIFGVARVDADTIELSSLGTNDPAIVGTYTGGGYITRVNQIQINTKQFNFYTDRGDDLFVPYVDFLVSRTSSGQITADYSVSSSSEFLVSQGINQTGAAVGTNILETSPYALIAYEQTQDRLWHRIYYQASGNLFQMRFYLSQLQLEDPDMSLSPFALHAMLIYAQRDSTRLS